MELCLIAALLVATVVFTVAFIVCSYYDGPARIGTDLGGFAGSVGGWEFSPALVYLLAAMGFGACFTLAVFKRAAVAVTKPDVPAAVAERTAHDALRIVKRSTRDVDRLVRTAMAAVVDATAVATQATAAAADAAAAARGSAAGADDAARAASRASESAEQAATATSLAAKEVAAVRWKLGQMVAAPEPARACRCIGPEASRSVLPTP